MKQLLLAACGVAPVEHSWLPGHGMCVNNQAEGEGGGDMDDGQLSLHGA